MKRALRQCCIAGRRSLSCLAKPQRRVLVSSYVTTLPARPEYGICRTIVGNRNRHRRHSDFTSSTLSLAEPIIYALSTAPGRAAIAVIRISGTGCYAIYDQLCPKAKPLRPRYTAVRALYEPGADASPESLLDPSALILYFPGPRSVTGEDVLELHVHGGTAVVKAVLAAISKCRLRSGSIRYAEPGEFTRRAFMNDRLDLTQVEALGDTLSASTEQQRRLSVRGTTNRLATRYESWRNQLLYARGELEALIDFSEDQHFDESPAVLTRSVAEQVRSLLVLVEAHSRNAVRGEMLRNGISISLLGAPNAGKSSLLNRVVGREAAIVSQEAGTTRDVVEVGIDLGGYLCRLGDTAGLRSALDPSKSKDEHMQSTIGLIEQEGMRRAKARAAESQVVIVVLSLEVEDGEVVLRLDPEVVETAAALSREHGNVLVVLNKIDRLPDATFDHASAINQVKDALPDVEPDQIFSISCRDAEQSSDRNAGKIATFLSGLIAKFQSMTSPLGLESSDIDPSIWQESLGATERHRLLLDECHSNLQQFLLQVETDDTQGEGEDEDIDIVLAAESLRAAANCLAKITGRGDAADTEEVLGVVFEKFCVGK